VRKVVERVQAVRPIVAKASPAVVPATTTAAPAIAAAQGQ
jgi:hypothetical protein